MSRSFRFKEENFFPVKAPFPCMNRFEPGHPINHWLILLKNAAVALNHLFCYHFFIQPEPVWALCVVEGQDLEGSALALCQGGLAPLGFPSFWGYREHDFDSCLAGTSFVADRPPTHFFVKKKFIPMSRVGAATQKVSSGLCAGSLVQRRKCPARRGELFSLRKKRTA